MNEILMQACCGALGDRFICHRILNFERVCNSTLEFVQELIIHRGIMSVHKFFVGQVVLPMANIWAFNEMNDFRVVHLPPLEGRAPQYRTSEFDRHERIVREGELCATVAP